VRGNGKEVGAILRRILYHQAHVSFVNQRGRLQNMAGPFALHVGASHAAQFVIHQRNQSIGCFLVARAELRQQTRYVATRPSHVAPYLMERIITHEPHG
jgi:hypothetical protein